MELLTKNIFLEILEEKQVKVFKLSDGVRKISLNSFKEPYLKAKDIISNYPISSSKLILLIGFGAGYEFEEIVKIKKPDSDLIIFEPDIGILNKIVKIRNLEEILEKNVSKIYSLENLDDFKKYFESFRKEILFSNPVIIENPAYKIFFSNFILKVKEEIEKVIEVEKCIYETRKMIAANITKNITENFQYLVESSDVSNLFGVFKDKPAIITSAGPSLKKQLPILKKAKDKAVIVCVDTALRVLLDEKIRPDIVVSIDFTSKNYKHFEGIDTSQLVFVFDFQVYPNCVKHHYKFGGKYFRVFNTHPLSEFISKFTLFKGELPLGGSTSHAALHLCVRMGCNPITLIGQDLSYINNQTHCEGVATNEVIKDFTNLVDVDGYYGGKVKTSSSLFTILKDFERIIESYKNITIFNSTEGGAIIKNAKNLPFFDFVEYYCKYYFYPSKTIEQLSLKESFFDYESFLNELSFFIPRLSRVIYLSLKAKKLLNIVIDGIAEKDSKKINKISEIKNIYEWINEDPEISNILYFDLDYFINYLKIDEEFKNYNHEILTEMLKERLLFDKLFKHSYELRNFLLKIKKNIIYKKTNEKMLTKVDSYFF
ncbi:MAG: DUF115 domain-containing protein [Elusimicrobiales bacterium]|nr:DUF115 domain-containing protein [Elusimicrobiales bacterium]